MAGLREHKKAETREAITAAALKIFSEKGFEKTSIEDIAREAGIGKATIYGYFDTKEDIFATYCNEALAESFSNLQNQEQTERPLIDLLVDFFMIKFRFLTRDNEFGRQLLREMVFPKQISEKAKEHDQRYFDILEVFFRQAQARGEIAPDQDLFLLSVHFFSLYLGVLVGWYTGYVENYQDIEKAMRTLFLQTIEGIGQ